MLSRVAVVSLAVSQQAEITHQVSSEMQGVQTSLETSQRSFNDMIKAAEDIPLIVGRTREASGILAR